MTISESENQYYNDDEQKMISEIKNDEAKIDWNTSPEICDGEDPSSAPPLQRQDQYSTNRSPGAFSVTRRVRDNDDDTNNEEENDIENQSSTSPSTVRNDDDQRSEVLVHAVLVEQEDTTTTTDVTTGSEAKVPKESIIIAKAQPILDNNDVEDHDAKINEPQNRVFVRKRYLFMYAALLLLAIIVSVAITITVDRIRDHSKTSSTQLDLTPASVHNPGDDSTHDDNPDKKDPDKKDEDDNHRKLSLDSQLNIN